MEAAGPSFFRPLEGKYPLAALILRRAMIVYELNQTKATR
jgi:hypothetical protein